MHRHGAYFASAAACACALSFTCALPAYAVTIDDLATNYQMATMSYENALVEQKQNSQEISAVTDAIEKTEAELEQSKENLGDSAIAIYKHERNRSDLLSLMLESESIADAVVRYDNYVRIENYWNQTVQRVKQTRLELGQKKDQLEEERVAIADKVDSLTKDVDSARAALRDADHSDGAQFHQKQGSSSNCGATSFIVGVNILLHENRYPDNVEVWKGPGFNGDSTHSLDIKGATWLMAKGLADKISCEAVPGDIHFTAQLKAELEQGKVVVISAGPGSVWQRADGTATGSHAFPDGHWIVFYYYKDGVYYSNDSSVGAKQGAGCAYTESQMQEWLNGRGNHFAVSLSKKQFGEDVPGSSYKKLNVEDEDEDEPKDEADSESEDDVDDED